MRVLVVDDEPAVRDAVQRALKLDNYDVETAADGVEALNSLKVSAPDLIVLDLLMPKVDGLDVCRRLRAAGDSTPILMLTARDSVENRVEGLDAGADDYLVKPFALDELLARVRALLRRSSPTEGEQLAKFADVTLDPVSREVTRGTRQIQLTRTEFLLLELFLNNPRRVLSREIILDRVWGFDFGPESNSLEVYIGYLRKKMEAGDEPRLIHTIRGVGYVLRDS
ncbi:MAG: response regulator transcription factor [Actinobacteria bacterium]|nr:response regulator transcription factor [Actinomycetota bacterium]